MAKFAEFHFRDCLKIPDKPHCGFSRVLRTQPGTPFHRLACHQTQRLRTPLAIFQTVSPRTRVNKPVVGAFFGVKVGAVGKEKAEAARERSEQGTKAALSMLPPES